MSHFAPYCSISHCLNHRPGRAHSSSTHTQCGALPSDIPVSPRYLFKRFSNIHREGGGKGTIEKFVSDLHSGKLHQNFHHPVADEDDDEPLAIEGPNTGEAKPDQPTAKPKSLKEKLEKAEDQVIDHDELKVKVEINEKVEPAHEKEHDEPHLDHDDPHDDPMKPVPVKSILKNLKPSQNRYSFSHNRDEF